MLLTLPRSAPTAHAGFNQQAAAGNVDQVSADTSKNITAAKDCATPTVFTRNASEPVARLGDRVRRRGGPYALQPFYVL